MSYRDRGRMKKGQALYDEMKRASDARKNKSKTTTTTTTTAKKKPSVRFGVGSNKIIKKDGKQFANVTADQLERTGLSQAAYMKMWNKTGKRPTKASVNAAKTESKTIPKATRNAKNFRGRNRTTTVNNSTPTRNPRGRNRVRTNVNTSSNTTSNNRNLRGRNRTTVVNKKKRVGNQNPRGRAGRNY